MSKIQNDFKRQDSLFTQSLDEQAGDSISPKKKLLEFARRFNIEIVFREDITIGQNDITLEWSDGTTDFYSVLVKPN